VTTVAPSPGPTPPGQGGPAGPADAPHATAAGTTVTVTARSSDPEVVRAAAQAAAAGRLDRWACASFELGARALLGAGRDADTTAVARAAEAAAGRVEAAAERARDGIAAAVAGATGRDGALAAGVAVALDGLRAGIADLVESARGTAAEAAAEQLRQVGETTAATTRQLLAGHEAGLRQLASADHPAWALIAGQVRDTQAETRALVVSLHALVEARDAAAAVGRGTATKGASTELTVAQVLSDVAIGHGDLPEQVGATTGSVGGRRVGDWVASLSSPAARGRDVRVVAEVKDSGSVSLPALARELDVALENRRAGCALAVVRCDLLPGGRRVVVLGDRRLAVAWQPGEPTDLLAACYAVARLVAVVHTAAALGDGDSLLPGLRAHVAAAMDALKALDALDRAVGQATRCLADAAAASELVRRTVGAALARAARLLEGA